MKLYYSKGACSLATRIVINEIGLECEYESVDLKTKKTQAGTDYYSINPKGAVPVLQLDQDTVLTENATIMQYLADHAKADAILPMQENINRYRVLEWLNYVATELHKGFGSLFSPDVPNDLKNSLFKPLLQKKFTYVNNALGQHSYLNAERFTLPDAYLFVMLRWANGLKIDLSELQNLTRYFNELKARASIQKSLREEGIE